MKLTKAVKPPRHGAKARAAEAMLKSLTVAKEGILSPQRAILIETVNELQCCYRASKRTGIKIEIQKTNGHGWNVWRVA